MSPTTSNNILTGIVGYAELAQEQLPDHKAAKRSLEILLSGTQRAKLLTGQLLSFANRELRTLSKIDLIDELQQLIPLLTSIVARSAKIVVDSPEKRIFILGDRSQIQQVFMNLILNAAESMSHRSERIVRISLRVEWNDVPEQSRCYCSVSDTGCGISTADLRRVFEPFFTSKAKGHGLGLACTRRIVEEHGGQIEISSKAGVGTTVDVKLPVLQDPSLTDSGTQYAAANDKSQRVLIVDDENEVRDVLRLMLCRMGYDVHAVANGPEAIALFLAADVHFDAVMLDLMMPGMNGWECRRELTRIRPSVPIIIMSGFAPQLPPGESLSQLSNAFLTKPFTKASLKTALSTVFTSCSEKTHC